MKDQRGQRKPMYSRLYMNGKKKIVTSVTPLHFL